MAWGGRTYNKGGNQGQAAAAPAPQQQQQAGNGGGGFQRRNSGGGGGFNKSAPKNEGRKFGRQQSQQDDKFEFITGLFQSQSGNSFTVFLTPEILEAFASLQEGDMIGVNENSKDSTRFSLWVRRGDGQNDGTQGAAG